MTLSDAFSCFQFVLLLPSVAFQLPIVACSDAVAGGWWKRWMGEKVDGGKGAKGGWWKIGFRKVDWHKGVMVEEGVHF